MNLMKEKRCDLKKQLISKAILEPEPEDDVSPDNVPN